MMYRSGTTAASAPKRTPGDFARRSFTAWSPGPLRLYISVIGQRAGNKQIGASNDICVAWRRKQRLGHVAGGELSGGPLPGGGGARVWLRGAAPGRAG